MDLTEDILSKIYFLYLNNMISICVHYVHLGLKILNWGFTKFINYIVSSVP